MRKIILRIDFTLKLLGFNAIKFFRFFEGLPFYFRDYFKLKKQMKEQNDFRIGKLYPILDERNSVSGEMSGHYFHQDLIIARRIYENKPIRHIDIGSRIDGFISHVAVFREIEIFDIRPQKNNLKNIKFHQADLMQLPDDLKNCCDSISSLHAIEHFGLGRYGDPINLYGFVNAIDNIYLMLKDNGRFYFSVPIGKQRIEFNAHRVFNLGYLLKILNQKFYIDYFHYINDNGDLIEYATLTESSIMTSFDCNYGCGVFELRKK